MSIQKSYYGPFFWLAIVSFVVPLVVAVRAFQEVRVTSKPTPMPDASGVDHALWDYLLKTYVENGLVDYDGMSRDHLFRTYLHQLAAADPSKLPSSFDRLALACNAYNALVINGVITHRIRDSVMNYHHEGREFFDIPEHIFGGKTMSLNELEHKTIRTQWHDPRVHVALVCAATSCPAIRPEAYEGRRLEAQLEDQSRLFANSPRYVVFDTATNTVQLSPILDWYGDDWKPVGGYLLWLAERIDNAAVKQAIERAALGELPVAFFEYDWSLNTQTPGGAGQPQASKKKADFGSGSIPNE